MLLVLGPLLLLLLLSMWPRGACDSIVPCLPSDVRESKFWVCYGNTESDPLQHILSQHYLSPSAVVDPNDPNPGSLLRSTSLATTLGYMIPLIGILDL